MWQHPSKIRIFEIQNGLKFVFRTPVCVWSRRGNIRNVEKRTVRISYFNTPKRSIFTRSRTDRMVEVRISIDVGHAKYELFEFQTDTAT